MATHQWHAVLPLTVLYGQPAALYQHIIAFKPCGLHSLSAYKAWALHYKAKVVVLKGDAVAYTAQSLSHKTSQLTESSHAQSAKLSTQKYSPSIFFWTYGPHKISHYQQDLQQSNVF